MENTIRSTLVVQEVSPTTAFCREVGGIMKKLIEKNYHLLPKIN